MSNGRQSPLGRLAETLSSERDALIRSVAALQLVPTNATKWMRFERIIEVCSSTEAAVDERTVSNGRLRQLLSTAPIATPDILSAEDPFEESFTAEITFYGGSYTVVAGGATAAHSACQLVLEAVRALPDDSHDDYKANVVGDATVLLTLSDEMCRRAGLGRWEAPAESPATPLLVPSGIGLDALRRAVSFTDAELVEILGPAQGRVGDLTAPGPLALADHEDESPTDDRAYLYPLRRLADDSTVIALPGALAASVAHRALAGAIELGATEAMVAALHRVTMRAVAASVDRLRWQPVSAPQHLDAPPGFGESFWRFDIDKVAHVVTLVDPLDGYKPGKPYGSVDFRSIERDLHERFRKVRDQREDIGDPEILHVVCSAALGRSWFLGFTAEAIDERSTLLVLNTDELDVITGCEPPDPLGLWKFARASDVLHERTKVLSFSTLDEYAIYRDRNDGFYLSDDRLPTTLSIASGSGAKLRVSERQRRDPHAVPLPGQNAVVNVSRWPADDATPIYQPEDPRFRGHRLVELSRPCWVIPTPGPGEDRESSEDLADVIAFWLWRTRDHLTSALAAMGTADSSLVVRVRLAPQTPGFDEDAAIEPANAWLQYEIAPEGGRIDLTLLDGARNRLRGPDNHAERTMAGTLVEAIHHLTGTASPASARAIADGLPAGPMKMFHVLGVGDDLLLALGYTGRPRLVSAADTEVVLDEVGDICRNALGLGEGPIAAEDRTKVLNGVVGELFTRMGDALRDLETSDLLENLAAEQEAISFQEARDQLLIPSQSACFGDDSSAVRRAVASRHDLISTAVASRFLIEYTTAISPAGHRPLSVATYDRLLAIAKEIVELGYLSDAIRYGLSTSELAVLPSGRLGTNREESFHQTLQLYTDLTSRRSVDAARRAFARHWSGTSSSDSDFDPAALNEALQAEFGIAATEHAHLSGDLIQMARNAPRQIRTCSLDALVDELSHSFSWPPKKVRRGLALFQLGPLDAFPPAANPTDGFPWRFSRDRSAARRPLYVRPEPSDGYEVVWGPRSVYRSSRYLLDQILSARLKAHSHEMQRYIVTVRRDANAEFNHQVADLYRRAGYTDVRENVKRIGRIRLARPNGQDIGDIDVFVIDLHNKVLLAVEVKDFEFARTPVELGNELPRLSWTATLTAHPSRQRVAKDLVRRGTSSSRRWAHEGMWLSAKRSTSTPPRPDQAGPKRGMLQALGANLPDCGG